MIRIMTKKIYDLISNNYDLKSLNYDMDSHNYDINCKKIMTKK